ncbi:MAG: magnesium transporter [Dehalococcoidia bacterium]
MMNREAAQDLLSQHQFHDLQGLLANADPVEIAQLIEAMEPEEAAVAFRLLNKDLAIRVFEWLDPEDQHALLDAFSTERARDLLKAMSPDDRAALLDEVPAAVARRLLQLLSPKQRRVTMELLGYEEGTAARLMTPDFVDLRQHMTVAEALERIRRTAMNRETIYYNYVIDDERHLLGIVTLKDLVLADPPTVVSDIMTPNPKAILTDADQEEAARILSDYDLLAAPVVDREDRLVGIITWDDMSDVMEREVTEDIYRYGAVPATEHEYFNTGIASVVRRRMPWLFLLILVNTVTGTVIAGQSALLDEVVILAAFVPLLIGTGGNVGAQSSTVVIRGLATGEITPGQVIGIVGREIGVGILLGVALGVLVLGWAYLLGRDERVAIVVGTTLITIATMAATVGAALPFFFRKIKLDPAMVSAPFITTVMDIFGVVVYFVIANLLLRI